VRYTRFLVAAVAILSLAGCQSLGSGEIATVTTIPATPAAPPTPLPNAPDSLKFCVLGDFGTGSTAQYQLATQMAELHKSFPFEMCTLVGDNLYGGQRPRDFQRKFEIPYKPLLDSNVKFYASLGNHDSREQRFYKLFNMDGKLYYSFKAPKQDVRFFALETTYPVPEQIRWVEEELKKSDEKWKIAFFHHPLYSSAGRHGSDLQLRQALEPLFTKYNVNVVFAGHDHIYERIKPQNGIAHFVTGSGGQLRRGDGRRPATFSDKIVDSSQVFLVAEISGDRMVFNAVNRAGTVVDSGVVVRQELSSAAAPPAEQRP
jgi:predicted MPP superfamily phosphohydrolase